MGLETWNQPLSSDVKVDIRRIAERELYPLQASMTQIRPGFVDNWMR